jgi:phosphomannomutase
LLLSLQVAKKGQTIVYDDSCSLAVPQELAQKQIIAKPSRSGHTYIKQGMRSHSAIFGGEVSGHYMYKDFFYCESALLTILYMIDLLVESDRPLSALVIEYSKYVQLPQLNVTCAHQEEAFTALRQAFSTCQIQEGDGIRVTSPDFWFKARRSQTEPLVRITLEAKTQQILDETSKKIIRLLDLFKE